MRYKLRCSEGRGEVTITPSPSCGSEAGYSASVILEDQAAKREVVIGPGLVQVRQEDGSFRRLAFTAGSVDSKEIQFFYGGRPRSVQSVGGVGGGVEGTQSEGAVTAPMNGQVVKVPVSLGDSVESGDIILILEAMKMENEVTAPIAGKLVELSVAPGQTVSPGQPLFQIEAIE
ncbi:MAG: biotin/lipoyl-binding protein [Candidatus Eremiobacteraeota bacterium]|nr:biotin/lipoyl-binding protein [Candidatus Eremiobacteraeota bacterium]